MGLPIVGQKALGFRTFFGTWVAPGARVTFLGPAGVFEDTFTENNRVATLNAALARCRSGKNDVIFVLPGFAENVSTADYASSLVAGTKIIGLGTPGEASAPVLTWTAAAATFLLDVADVVIQNMTLDWTGIADVAAPITVSGAGCQMLGNLIIVQDGAIGADQGVEVGATANGFKFNGNTCIAVDEDEPMTGGGVVEISGAADNIEVQDNYICGAAAATVGLIRVSAAATNLRIKRNQLVNLETTSGAVAILISSATAMGVVTDNDIKVMTGADPNAADVGISLNSATLILNARNYVVDDSDLGAILSEPHAGT